MPTFKIQGMLELKKSLKKLENIPQKCVSTAARKGMLIAKSSAKQGKWIDQTGYLRKGISTKAEKSKIKGKKVYEVTFNRNMNDVFVKMSKAGKRYYYPASQEYGFKTRDGDYAPGFHFLKDAMEDNSIKIAKTMIDVLVKEIDKL